MKERPSKLDAHAAKLDEMFATPEEGGRGLTLDQAREELRLDGVSVSCSALSVWWANRRQAKLQERLLGQIASGARQVQQVEAQFQTNPAPELDSLIKLHRVIILQLATQANAHPEMIDQVTAMMKPVLDYAKLMEKRREQDLSEAKYRDQVAQRKVAIEREVNKARTTGGLTPETLGKIEAELKLL